MGISYKRTSIMETSGEWNTTLHKWDVSLSSILIFLIKEAAKCVSFLSDLFISWRDVEDSLDIELYRERQFFFGFWNLGIDNLLNINYEYSLGSMSYIDYRAIYMLEGTETEGFITFTLYRIEVTGYESD